MTDKCWRITFGEKSILVDDMSPATFQKIADRHGIAWMSLYWHPAKNVHALHDLVVEAAGLLEVDPPAKPESMRDLLALCDSVTMEDDDRPKAWDSNGNPASAGDQETTSSSGSPATTDGPQA